MKTKYFLLLVILLGFIDNSIINAQVPNYFLAQSIGGGDNDYGYASCIDSFGNFYLAGEFRSNSISFGTTTFVNTGNPGSGEIFIAKYDATGNLMWVIEGTGNDMDQPKAVCYDPNGFIYITGYSNSSSLNFDTVTCINNGNSGFLTKLDTAGNVIWINRVGNGNATVDAVSISANGEVYVTGGFNSATLNFGPISLVNSGNFDAYLAKYSVNGSIIWAKKMAGNNFEMGNSVYFNEKGYIYVAGNFQSSTCEFDSISVININANNYDAFLAQYDTSGNVIWVKSCGGNGYDQNIAITSDTSGNVYITGNFNSVTLNFGSITLSNSTSTYDIFIAKYNSAGNPVWAKKVYGNQFDTPTSICSGIDGNVYLTGWFYSPTLYIGAYTLTNASWAEDFFVAKYDGMGNIIWTKRDGDVNRDIVSSINIDYNDNIYLAGYFMSPVLTLGPFNLNNVGNTDIFWAVLNNSVGFNELNTEVINFFPNPTKGIIQYHLTEHGKIEVEDIEVFTSLGSKLELQNKFQIDLSDQEPGIYAVLIRTNSGSFLKKVVVVK